MEYRLILASSSQSRRQILEQAGLTFEVNPSQFDEASIEIQDPVKLVETLAQEKAQATAALVQNAYVLAADTVVAFENKVLGKPVYKMDAVSMLKELSNTTHTVLTGWTLIKKLDYVIKTWTGNSTTQVTFRRLQKAEIEAYANDYDVTQWSAGYNPYSRALSFITHIEGSYSGFHGLPLEQILPLINY